MTVHDTTVPALTGDQLIGANDVRGTGEEFHAADPRTGERLEPAYRLGVELGRQSRHYLLDDPTLLGRVIVERSRGRWNTSR